MSFYEAQNAILKLYVTAFIRKAASDDEVVEMTGALARTDVLIFELTDEFLPTIPKNDPTYPVRVRGVEQMKLGMAAFLAGGIQTLTEKES